MKSTDIKKKLKVMPGSALGCSISTIEVDFMFII